MLTICKNARSGPLLLRYVNRFIQFCAFALLALILCLPAQAKDNVFSSQYFDVALTNGWEVQGRPQNSLRAVNVNFINDARNVKINVVIGSANVSVDEQLEQMRQGIRRQGGMVHQIRSVRDMKYFTFILGDWPGFCYVGSNGKDLAIIIAVGNRSYAARFIKSFYNRDKSLFPDF